MNTILNKRQLAVGLSLLVVAGQASAATGLDGPLMNGLRFFIFFVSFCIMVAIGWGVIVLVKAAFGLNKLKEPNQDPDFGRKLGIDGLRGVALIGIPAIIVMAIVTIFGSTDVINFMFDGQSLNTNDMLNLGQGQGASPSTGG